MGVATLGVGFSNLFEMLIRWLYGDPGGDIRRRDIWRRFSYFVLGAGRPFSKVLFNQSLR